MTSGGPDLIAAEAARKALSAGQEQAAHAREAGIERAQLDRAELRELERSELYAATPRPSRPSRLRTIVDRLLRRSA